MVTVNTGKDEIPLIQCFRALSTGTNTHRRERVPYAGEEATLLRQRSTIGYHTEGIHLQAVVVMEAQRLMLDHTLVQLETTLFQTLSAAGMAGVQNRHIVLFCHFIDCSEQRIKVFLGVNILLTMGRKQNIFTLFQSQTGVDIGCLDLGRF